MHTSPLSVAMTLCSAPPATLVTTLPCNSNTITSNGHVSSSSAVSTLLLASAVRTYVDETPTGTWHLLAIVCCQLPAILKGNEAVKQLPPCIASPAALPPAVVPAGRWCCRGPAGHSGSCRVQQQERGRHCLACALEGCHVLCTADAAAGCNGAWLVLSHLCTAHSQQCRALHHNSQQCRALHHNSQQCRALHHNSQHQRCCPLLLPITTACSCY
jgi:hypothetical protein